MSVSYELVERPELEAPVLVLALDGWIDAGFGAANARSALLERLDTVAVVTFDADALLDHRARRPALHLADGVVTGLEWPSVELRAATDTDGNDLLLLVGAEPDHTWQAFSEAVVDLAMDFGARLAVGLGAYPAPAPHTRPVRLAASASTPELARRFDYLRATIDVPAGVQAAIEHRAAQVGVPAIGLWAQVPHYAAAMPYPAASAALVDGLARLAELTLDSTELHTQATSMRRRLDSLISDNAEHAAMVRQLEEQIDAAGDAGALTAGPLPSGDELAAEVERYLREQDI